MYTRRRQLQIMMDEVDKKKIKKANEYIFEYLAKEGFSLIDTRCLISSMGNVVGDMKKNDPLRKIQDFDYSSSVESVFKMEEELSNIAISRTES